MKKTHAREVNKLRSKRVEEVFALMTSGHESQMALSRKDVAAIGRIIFTRSQPDSANPRYSWLLAALRFDAKAPDEKNDETPKSLVMLRELFDQASKVAVSTH